MRKIPAIKSVMTAFPYSVDVESTLEYAHDFLQQHEVGHLPLKHNGELVGVISLNVLRHHLTLQEQNNQLLLKDIPLGDAYIVDLNERLDRVLETMANKHLDAALVTRQQRLAGIFTSTDVCRSYAQHLREEFQPPSGDEVA